jgi:broad specificity phosphatase PhoE
VTLLALIRHAPTAWNQERRLQGRADIAITAAARDALAGQALPPAFRDWRVLSSPLSRCLQTAAALGLSPAIDPRLIEMDWGEFQGHTIAALRRAGGVAFRDEEARGLDFRPPRGESPRDVQARLAPLLAQIAADGRPSLAVTHRGVIRALYARATGWDMTGHPPHRLELYGTLQVFRLAAPDGAPTIEALNLRFVAR